MAGKKGMKDYPYDIKLNAVKDHLSIGMTKKEVLKKYNICNDSQLENWCRKYREFGEIGLVTAKRGRPKKGEICFPKSKETPLWKKIQKLEMENDLLKKYLEEKRRWSHPELPTE